MALAIAPLLASACTTVLYKGPSRPASQIAVVTSHDTMVDKVDSLMVREHGMGNHSRFEVLPGEHELGISLNRVRPGLFSTHVQHSGYVVVCVDLKPGRVYETRPIIDGDHWEPQVIDLATRRPIALVCDNDDQEPARPVAVAAPRAAPAAGSAGADTSDDEATPDATPTAFTPAGGTAPPTTAPPAPADAPSGDAPPPPPAPARPPAPRAADREEPTRPAVRRPAPAVSAGEAELSGRRPGSGLSLFFGFAFGGDDFVTASNGSGERMSLTAGGGVILGVNGMVTPLWVADSVGFGVGVDAAVKYDSIDAANGSASITRFPLGLTAHLLTNGSGGNHYFLLRGGITRDFGVNYHVSGIAAIDANIEGTWGPTAALGYYKRSTDSFAWHVLGFFSLTKHLVGSEKIDANAFGLTLGFHLNL